MDYFNARSGLIAWALTEIFLVAVGITYLQNVSPHFNIWSFLFLIRLWVLIVIGFRHQQIAQAEDQVANQIIGSY
jgi:hypothetical protein